MVGAPVIPGLDAPSDRDVELPQTVSICSIAEAKVALIGCKQFAQAAAFDPAASTIRQKQLRSVCGHDDKPNTQAHGVSQALISCRRSHL